MDRWEFGDPMEVAARRQAAAQRQERACGQCERKISMDWRGQTLHACGQKRRTYGVRCEFFRMKESA